jgi:hypothetical protein
MFSQISPVLCKFSDGNQADSLLLVNWDDNRMQQWEWQASTQRKHQARVFAGKNAKNRGSSSKGYQRLCGPWQPAVSHRIVCLLVNCFRFRITSITITLPLDPRTPKEGNMSRKFECGCCAHCCCQKRLTSSPPSVVDHNFVDYGIDIKYFLPKVWRIHRTTQVSRGIRALEVNELVVPGEPPPNRPQKSRFDVFVVKNRVILLAHFRKWRRYVRTAWYLCLR